MATQLVAALAVSGVQDGTSVGPVTSVRQVAAVHAFPEEAVAAAQDATGTSVVMFVAHVVVVKPLPTAAPLAVQLAAGKLLLTVVQIVAVHALAADAALGAQEATPAGATMMGAGHVVVV